MAFVVIGIAVAVAAVHFTGGSTRAKLAVPEQAQDRFREDFPDEKIAAVYPTSDGVAALLELDCSRLGIVQASGDKFLTRIVSAKDVAGVEMAGDRAVLIQLHDFTWRGGEFRFGDEKAAQCVWNALGSGNNKVGKLI